MMYPFMTLNDGTELAHSEAYMDDESKDESIGMLTHQLADESETASLLTQRIENTVRYIRELFREDFGGHDAEHSLRVYRNALRIAEREPFCDREIVALAALLHDADDHKLFSTGNNANARAFLEQNDVPPERIERICEVINSVSFSRNKGKRPGSAEAAIVQDADRLDAMGAVGIARTFAYGGEHGRPLEESVQHFHEKLLLLKDLMNTETGKNLAQKRHAFLETFLEEYREEMDEPDRGRVFKYGTLCDR